MDDLAARVVDFCRLLRKHDLPVTPAASLDAVKSLAWVDVADFPAFHAALRSNLLTSIDQFRDFDRLFVAYWAPFAANAPESVDVPDLDPTIEGPARPPEVVYSLQPVTFDGISVDGEARMEGGDRSASDTDLLTDKDFASFSAADVVRARRLIQALAPALATVRSRRYQPSSGGGEVDIRRTIRAAHRSGGEIIDLGYRRRRLRKLRIVALCDVSGSMDLYSNWLLQFLYALQNESGGVRTFVFSTRLHDVTYVLKRKRFEDALAAIAGAVDTWSGGTAIGSSLGEFNRRYAASLVSPRTVVLIASDGWERGETTILAREVAAIHRRAYRTIWLNPLKGRDGYAPLAAGMAAALPFIDHFLPAHNLAALARLKRTLSAI